VVRPVKAAAARVGSTSATLQALLLQFKKYGLRVEIVKMLPRPVFDVKLKDK